MKKRQVAAALAAVSILLCACGKKDDKDAKTKLAKEDSQATSKISEKTDDTKSTDEAFTPAFDLDKDLYSFFADDSYTPFTRMTCILSVQTSWSTIIDLDVEAKSFQGEYKSATGNIDGNGYDVLECDFSGNIDGFTRVNKYSFSTHVTKMETEKFETRNEKYMDMPATVSYAEPYGFVKADELILYLPNAPVAEIPKEVTEWLEGNAEVSETLDNYVLYNKAEGTAFLISAETFTSKTRQVTAAELNKLPDTLLDKHNGVTLSIDKASQTASLERGNTGYTDLHICGSADRDDILYIYGSNNQGHTIILQIAGVGPMTVLVSNDPDLPSGMFIDLK